MTRANSGAGLIALASVIAIGMAVFDYATPATGLAETGGVEIAGGAAALMLLAALAWAMIPKLPCWLTGFFAAAIGLDIMGSTLAAYLLESPVILGAMGLALIGWVIQVRVMRGRKRAI